MNRILWYGWQIVATAVVVTLLSSIIVYSLAPVYRATAFIPKQDANDLLMVTSAGFLETFVAREYLSSRQMAGLNETLSEYAAARGDASSRTVSMLRKNLSTSSGTDRSLISFESTNPQLAAELANLIAREYLTVVATRMQGQPDKSRLDIAERALLEFLVNDPSVTAAELDLKHLGRLISDKETQLSTLTGAISERHMVIESARNQFDPTMFGDSVLSRLLVRQEQLVSEKSSLSTRYGSQHVRIVSIDSEIREIKKLIETRFAAVFQLALDTLSRLEEQVAQLADDLDSLNTQRRELFDKRVRLQTLESEVEMARRSVDSVPLSHLPGFSEASVPLEPIYPNKIRMLTWIFVLTLCFLTILRVLMSRMERNAHE